MEELIQAISMLKSGNITEAQRVLAGIIKKEPNHEMAWLWMSRAVEDMGKRRICLERVISINPANHVAQRELKYLCQEEPANVQDLAVSATVDVEEEISASPAIPPQLELAETPPSLEPISEEPSAPAVLEDVRADIAPLDLSTELAGFAPTEMTHEGSVKYCSNCGQKVEGNYCSNCGQPQSSTDRNPLPEAQSIIQPPAQEPAPIPHQDIYISTPVEPLKWSDAPTNNPPTDYVSNKQNYKPTTVNRFSAKRVITAVGMAFIVFAGTMTWEYTREWRGLLGGGYTNQFTAGITTGAGIVSTGAAVLGMILIFAIENETAAHAFCAILSIISAIAAYLFMAETGDVSYWLFGEDFRSMAGTGIYVVFLGTAITLACFLIPSHKRGRAN